MTTRIVDGCIIELQEVDSIKSLRAKIKAFAELFGSEPKVKVSGYFTCASSGDPVRLSYAHTVTRITPARLHVDLGSEGVAQIRGDQVPQVRFSLCRH